ncbi:MAG TPA: hypothetical protein VF706_00510, partial [Solirubrobacteraceae bacterium]
VDAGVAIGPSSTTPTIAYVQQSGTSQPVVWTIHADGTQNTRVGYGFTPVIAPSGLQVAASLFGVGPGESGSALAVYSTSGAPTQTYFNLKGETTQPLAWSRDGRYLAVDVQSISLKTPAKLSGLAIVDVTTGVAKVIAHGQIYGASFAPNGSDEVVYGRSATQSPTARVNVYRSNADGSGTVALTRDGRSLFPLWGSQAIAYDRERLRREDAPVYQIWLRSPNGATRRLTNIRVRTLVSGLVPIAFSADGSKLLAQFIGQDTSEAWTVRVASGRVHRLAPRSARFPLQAAGLSSDGSTLLVNEGGVDGPASEGRVATLPFAGGRSTVLVAHGAQASWNG